MEPTRSPEIKSGEITLSLNQMRELMSKNEKESGLKTIVNRIWNFRQYGYMDNDKLLAHLHNHITQLSPDSIDEDTKTFAKELSWRILGKQMTPNSRPIAADVSEKLEQISKKIDPNAEPNDKKNFIAFCKYGDPKSVEMMFKSSTIKKGTFIEGLTAACENNNAKVIDCLLPYCKKFEIDTKLLEQMRKEYNSEPIKLISPTGAERPTQQLLFKAIDQSDIPALAYGLNCLRRFHSEGHDLTQPLKNTRFIQNNLIPKSDLIPKSEGKEIIKQMLVKAKDLPSIIPETQYFSRDLEDYETSTPEKKKEIRNLDRLNKELDTAVLGGAGARFAKSHYEHLLPDLLEDAVDPKNTEFKKYLQLLTRYINKIPYPNKAIAAQIIYDKITELESKPNNPSVKRAASLKTFAKKAMNR